MVWTQTPEGRERMREIARARWAKPGYRKKMLKALRGSVKKTPAQIKDVESKESRAEKVIAREARKKKTVAPRPTTLNGGITIMWNGLAVTFTDTQIELRLNGAEGIRVSLNQ